MPFTDHVESMIEKASDILKTDKNVIKNEFTRFNTIYVGSIKKNRVTFELQLTLPEIARVMKYEQLTYYIAPSVNPGASAVGRSFSE